MAVGLNLRATGEQDVMRARLDWCPDVVHLSVPVL